MRLREIGLFLLFVFATTECKANKAGDNPDGFRPYILRAIESVDESRKHGGYNISKAFTQDLTYGKNCCIRASKPREREPGPNPTMCVAAVAEIIVEALNIYGKENKDWTFTEQLPMKSWNSGSTTSIRANLFMYKGAGSHGTASALKKLGIGRVKPFSELQAGDFINFNRTKSGHAVVFMGYLNSGAQETKPTFSGNQTIGFRYFSAQGKNRPDGGLGYRSAYFEGHCPTPRGKDDDCGVIKAYSIQSDGSITQNYRLLNSGEIFMPTSWRIDEAMESLRADLTRSAELDTELVRDIGLAAAVEAELNRELQEDTSLYVDGTEED